MNINDSVKNLPTNPGVYLMYNKDNVVIYVGKAKNLKNRVSSYFRKNTSHTPKVVAMVENIYRFEYIIVESEFEALVLECNLIKRYQPYYNILLKDDKTYPFIKVTVNETFPRIYLSRKPLNDKAMYFGPYLSAKVVNDTINLIKDVFSIRSCNKTLTDKTDNLRPCLNYQIQRCSAPCAGLISVEEYRKQIDKAVDFLNGNTEAVINNLEDKMKSASENLQFEKAAKIRDKIYNIKQIREKQKITSVNAGNKDFVAMQDMGAYCCFVILIVRDGKMVNQNHYIIKNSNKDDRVSLLTDFIKQHYSMTEYIPNKLLLQFEIDDMLLIEKWLSEKCGNKITISVPVKGENKRLIEMAVNNATERLKLHLVEKDVKKRKFSDLSVRIKDVLGLQQPPMRIESYDISNISGSDSVGVCVVFENCVPKKSAYRLFNINSVDGSDDYESIRETLYRRLENGINDVPGFELPDLIMIDGGKGHVKVAKEIVDFYNLDIPVYGMVKDNNHRTRGVTTETEEISIKRTDPLFNFFTQLQDETHRFAVASFHKKHKKSQLKSELTSIKGVGEAKKIKLLKAFKDINSIKVADVDELSKVVDAKTAQNIYDYFKYTN